MYHALLAAALVTAGTSPNHCHSRCHGCYSSCYGCHGNYAGYGGYSGYSGHGCLAYGCYASGYGCAGACYGYHGGCYGGFGVFNGDPYYVGGPGFYGCYGGYSCYGVPLPVVAAPGGGQPPARDPFPPINPEGKKKPDGEEVPTPKEKKKLEEEQARAKITIDVPVGGKLFVDGKQVNVAAGPRTFKTPALQAGESYYYDIRIEIVRQGEVLSEERRIFIRPGEQAAVAFPNLGPTLTARAPR